MPLPVWVLTRPILSRFLSKFCTKTFNPKPNCFVTDINATFMQDVFHLTKTQWITYVIHHCQSDDFRWSLEVFEGRTCCHSQKIGINRKTVKFVWQRLRQHSDASSHLSESTLCMDGCCADKPGLCKRSILWLSRRWIYGDSIDTAKAVIGHHWWPKNAE